MEIETEMQLEPETQTTTLSPERRAQYYSLFESMLLTSNNVSSS